MCTYPKPDRLVLACRMVVALWVLTGAFITVIFPALVLYLPPEPRGYAIVAVLAVIYVVLLAELCLAYTLACPACARPVLLQGSGPFYPGARHYPVGGYYAVVVMDVLRRRRFTCMYCGHPCVLAGADTPPRAARAAHADPRKE